MSAPRIEAIALVGSHDQRIYISTRVGTLYEKQKRQQEQGTDNGAEASTSTQLTAAKVRDEALRLEYAAHCALDAVEERSQQRTANGDIVPSTATYLGLVLTLEDLAVYAMTTSTKLRILVLICPGEAKIRDIDCVTILRAIHTCYLSYISNAFLALPPSRASHAPAVMSLGQPSAHIEIKSPLFDRRIASIGGWV